MKKVNKQKGKVRKVRAWKVLDDSSEEFKFYKTKAEMFEEYGVLDAREWERAVGYKYTKVIILFPYLQNK